MYCSKCGNPIPDNARFCNLCGNPVTDTKLPTSENKSDSSKLIVIWAIILLTTTLLNVTLSYVESDWYSSPWRYVYHGLSIIRLISNILPVLAIKQKGAKITFIILVSIWIIYCVAQNVVSLYRML